MANTHTMSRGDAPMTDNKNIAETYQLGKTTVHIVDPGPVPDEEIRKILTQAHKVGWSIWNDLTPEQQRKINDHYE